MPKDPEHRPRPEECVAEIQQAGIQVQAGFILGFDSDGPIIFDNMIQFVQDSGIVVAMVGLLNAPRGTALYQRMAVEQRLTRPATGDNMDCSMNFLPKMGMQTLMDGLSEGYQNHLFAAELLPADSDLFEELQSADRSVPESGILRDPGVYQDDLGIRDPAARPSVLLETDLLVVCENATVCIWP